MTGLVEIITVDRDNVEEHGFFCYKSKRKAEGYTRKLGWLDRAFDNGLVIKMVLQGGRSVGFIEYIPGEHTWRVVDAPGYMVIHCLWVVGRAKKKGYGTQLLDLCLEDARAAGMRGVAVVSSRGNWLAHEKVFIKNGFEKVDATPPAFDLLATSFEDGPDSSIPREPLFPRDWDERCARFGEGVNVVYADQCPYMQDAVQHAVDSFAVRGLDANVEKLETSEDVRKRSPTAYGVYGIVWDGKLFSYHYLGKKELRRLDEAVAKRS